MNEINNILNNIGVNVSTIPNIVETVTPQVSNDAIPSVTLTSTLADDDIDDILADNGFSSISEESLDDIDEIIDNPVEMLAEVSYDDEDPEDSEGEEEGVGEVNTPTEESIDESTNLPLNSPTLLVSETTTRFSGAEWFNEIQKARVIIAGIGGIGSNVAFQLARMSPTDIYLYDDDTVETVNMAGQLYSRNDIGKAKVQAIADMIRSYTNMSVHAIISKFTPFAEPGDIMICGFDNMAARKVFFKSWYDHIKYKSIEDKKKCLYIDGRLSMDTLQVFCLTGDDDGNIERYQKEFLFDDSEAEETVCSMKQTTYLACMVGSVIVNMFTNFIANQLDPIIPYSLPFFTEYDAQNVIFKTEC